MINLNRMLEAAGPIPLGAMPIEIAMEAMLTHRLQAGFSGNYPLHTAPSDNYKLEKGDDGWMNYGLSLEPAVGSGYNACSHKTPGCEDSCVAHAGNGNYPSAKRGRIFKTRFLAANPLAFCTVLDHEITRAERKAERVGAKLADRLNAFADLRWENICPALFRRHPDVQFYDYTKWPSNHRHTPSNYHLTYSYSGERPNRHYMEDDNVAVVFDTPRGHPLPVSFLGRAVIDGDQDDARYHDEIGVVVGLRAKGKAVKDTTGFVVSAEGAS
jgi:hypothetical protein